MQLRALWWDTEGASETPLVILGKWEDLLRVFWRNRSGNCGINSLASEHVVHYF